MMVNNPECQDIGLSPCPVVNDFSVLDNYQRQKPNYSECSYNIHQGTYP